MLKFYCLIFFFFFLGRKGILGVDGKICEESCSRSEGLIVTMQGFRAKFRVVTLIALAVLIGLAALYGLLRPISNGCIMTYMYPTYIPILASEGVSSTKYGLYLYHEGWRKIDFKEHIKKLSGVPVLFIPGNGGSYKQARSLSISL